MTKEQIDALLAENAKLKAENDSMVREKEITALAEKLGMDATEYLKLSTVAEASIAMINAFKKEEVVAPVVQEPVQATVTLTNVPPVEGENNMPQFKTLTEVIASYKKEGLNGREAAIKAKKDYPDLPN